jgi:2-polyprenyl-6-methoxyphenol hydroxylase-like FAD-dependent oxidoreductase
VAVAIAGATFSSSACGVPAMNSDTDALIVGAGPTGLALAAELQRRGIRPLIIDRQPAGANTSRACVVHARTMEVLEPLGATRDLLAEGVMVPIFRVRDRDRALITIDFSEIESPYSFTLMIPQSRVEHCLLRHLEELGGSVGQPCELVRCHTRASFVEVEVRSNGATDTIKAPWLIGCDGMHSRVREQSGIAFEGEAYAQSFVLADVHMKWPLSREEVTLFYSPAGFMVVAPLPQDHFRIVATVDVAPEQPSVAYMQAVLDERGPETNQGRIRDVAWSSRFHTHHRVAQSSRKGRILLCGDAAHVHSPAGGQGMNTGIQDSVSLAETLADTLKDSDDTRLNTWATNRHAAAAKVVALTDRMTGGGNHAICHRAGAEEFRGRLCRSPAPNSCSFGQDLGRTRPASLVRRARLVGWGHPAKGARGWVGVPIPNHQPPTFLYFGPRGPSTSASTRPSPLASQRPSIADRITLPNSARIPSPQASMMRPLFADHR